MKSPKKKKKKKTNELSNWHIACKWLGLHFIQFRVIIPHFYFITMTLAQIYYNDSETLKTPWMITMCLKAIHVVFVQQCFGETQVRWVWTNSRKVTWMMRSIMTSISKSPGLVMFPSDGDTFPVCYKSFEIIPWQEHMGKSAV